MADYDIEGLNYQRQHFAPYGTMSQLRAELDLTGKARTAADFDFVLKLPQGVTITNVEMTVMNNAGTGDDVSVGTRQKGAGTWVDATSYFLSGASVAATGYFNSLAARRSMPLRITEEEVYLVVDHNDVIASTDNLKLGFYVWYEATGND